VNPVDIGRAEAQRRAAAELAESQYQHESPFNRIIRSILRFFGDLLDRTGDEGGGRVALIVIVMILVGLAALLLWQAGRATRFGAMAGEDVFGNGEHTAAEHRAHAERLAAEGRWAEAIRERLRAMARDLEERAIVDALPGRTAHELAGTAGRELPALAADLNAAADLFDDVTYGEADGTPEGYARLTRLDERLRGTAVAR